jgi:16S rRNA (uracil1498-N3)-methyltransferase
MRVMRLRDGDTVFLFDGDGTEVQGRLLRLDPGGAEVEVTEFVPADAEARLHVVLVQAIPVKLPRMDTIVRLATELGVDRIVPILSERGQLPGGGDRTLLRRVERWSRIAETAAQQCGRATVPVIEAPVDLRRMDLDQLPALRLVLDAAGEPLDHLAAELRQSAAAPPTALSLMVGPEGGWSDSEMTSAMAGGARRVSCGPRVLRADSAGAVALALVQYEWGDLSGTRRS